MDENIPRTPGAQARRAAAADPRLGAPLTARQSEILQLIAAGSSNKQIARQLRLTVGTVKQHLYAIFRKLGVRNRTAAVARSAFLPEPGVEALPQLPAAAAAAGELRFGRRLVTAVVVEPRLDPARSVRDALDADNRVRVLRARVERLAYAFDAAPELLPGGGIAVWFGQPVAHGDDAERAVAFVLALQRVSDTPFAAGIGTGAEVTGEGPQGLVAYRTFRLAMLMAAAAEPGSPLACAMTAELAGLPEPPGRTRRGAAAPPPAGARAVGAARSPSVDVARRWGGLPFMADLIAGARQGRCQWVAVESWPPEAGTRLIDAIGDYLSALGLAATRIWLPAHASRAEAARRLLGQMHEGFPASGLVHAPTVLRDAVAALGRDRPGVLLAYGIDGLQILASAIGDAGLQRLRGVPLIVVAGAMHRTGAPQTVVRLLGSHPGKSPFVRVLRMQVPADRPRALEGMRPDVLAVLDTVSPDARAIARLAADAPALDLAGVAGTLGLAPDAVVARCRELESSGLLTVKGGRLEFRDEATAAAVRASLA
jgi:DNA-binding CsgD family transcriptional regulator